MDKLKISIIIPMYNSQSTIERCLKSVLNQTYSNIEVLVIDDGSIDKSETIVNCLFGKDNRLKIYKSKNQGVSHARNIGLKNVTGDYVVFVDSDDYIELNMIEKLVNYIEKYQVEVVVYDPVFETQNGEFLKLVTKNIPPNIMLNKKQIIENVLSWIYGNVNNKDISFANKKGKELYMDCYNAPWEAIYQKKLIDGIVFNEKLNIYEDLLFNVEIYTKCNSLVYYEMPMYHYILNSSNSLATKFHENYIEIKTLLFKLMEDNVGQNHLPPSFKEYLQNRIVEDILSILINESKSKKSYRIKIKRIRNYIKNEQIKNAIMQKKTNKKSVNFLLFLLRMNLVGLTLMIVMFRLKLNNIVINRE